MASDTLGVSFDVGGVGEMVRYMETGYLAHHKNIEDLAHGMEALLVDKTLRQKMSDRSREIAVREYDITLQVQRYLALYQRLIDDQGQRMLEN